MLITGQNLRLKANRVVFKILDNPKSYGAFFYLYSIHSPSKIINSGEAWDERGLLGLAFHPKYKTNGHFYVFYSAPNRKVKRGKMRYVEDSQGFRGTYIYIFFLSDCG